MIFVFGSNLAGIHGAGAAKFALNERGAIWGRGYGFQGTSFAIPTKDGRIQTLPPHRVVHYVRAFITEAERCNEEVFQVTRIGCGLAGYTDAMIAPLFAKAPLNCLFDTAWQPILGDEHMYWGTL